MNMQENQYKKQGKHRKTQETEIQKKIPKRRKKIPQTIFYPIICLAVGIHRYIHIHREKQSFIKC